MKSTTLEFNSEKKHSVRYDDPAEGEVVSSVYVNKAALPKPYPKAIKLTIEWENTND